MHTRERETFQSTELAVVLSHFDLGTIESITEFVRGSHHSPKVGIVSDRGKFLLKRRSVDRAPPERVRFAHQLQAYLQSVHFPVPRLICTKGAARSVVQIRNHHYELFEFVGAEPYRKTISETQDAGLLLARFHAATLNFQIKPTWPVPRGDYHDAAPVITALRTLGSSLNSHDSFTGDAAELEGLLGLLLDSYLRAAEHVNRSGFLSWPEQLIHSDWHPGNLLFRNEHVVAVVDLDSARLSRRVLDFANGILQFSILASGEPDSWPDGFDEERFNAFAKGYHTLLQFSGAERQSIPELMAEALIAESAMPIQETGSFGRWPGFRMLRMVRRKLQWLDQHREKLLDLGSSA